MPDNDNTGIRGSVEAKRQRSATGRHWRPRSRRLEQSLAEAARTCWTSMGKTICR